MAVKKNIDVTTDLGMAKALNDAYAEYEEDSDFKKAVTRSGLIGRGIAIRNLRLREEQFRRNHRPRSPRAAKE